MWYVELFEGSAALQAYLASETVLLSEIASITQAGSWYTLIYYRAA